MTAMQLISVCTKTEKLLQVNVLIDRKCCVLSLHFVAPGLRIAHVQLTRLLSAFTNLKVQFDAMCA